MPSHSQLNSSFGIITCRAILTVAYDLLLWLTMAYMILIYIVLNRVNLYILFVWRSGKVTNIHIKVVNVRTAFHMT